MVADAKQLVERIVKLTLVPDVRKDLLAGEHTFTEIAKMVGERWQVLDLETKENYEEMAAKSKTRYNDEMVEYMKNTEYKNYQVYLKKWHAKQAEIQAEKGTLSIRKPCYFLGAHSSSHLLTPCMQIEGQLGPKPTTQSQISRLIVRAAAAGKTIIIEAVNAFIQVQADKRLH